MKQLRQFEIDAICDEVSKLVKEERVKQVQSKFDESEEKEQLLNLLPQINELEEKIDKLRAEQKILTTKEWELMTTLREKGVMFRREANKEYTLDLAGVSSVWHNVKHELILMGIDDGVKVKDIIKELVDKFK